MGDRVSDKAVGGVGWSSECSNALVLTNASWHAISGTTLGFLITHRYPASLKTALLPNNESHICLGLSAGVSKFISLTYGCAKDVTYVRLDQIRGSIFYSILSMQEIGSLILYDQVKRGNERGYLGCTWKRNHLGCSLALSQKCYSVHKNRETRPLILMATLPIQ